MIFFGNIIPNELPRDVVCATSSIFVFGDDAFNDKSRNRCGSSKWNDY